MNNQVNRNDQTLPGIPTEPVGSVPRPRELQDALVAQSQGNLTTEALDALFVTSRKFFMKYLVSISVILFAITPAAVSAENPIHKSDYAGQEKRLIKSLSDDDIQQLQQGEGWGLAKAAELNGMPGPAHILQMKEHISLTSEQEAKIQALFVAMKEKAIPLGNELIALEKNLNDSFADRTITDELLYQQLDAIANVRKELRYAHLVTHLMTPTILSPQQIEKYNQLRGYGSDDPCENIPAGHNAEMWKKHNGCE